MRDLLDSYSDGDFMLIGILINDYEEEENSVQNSVIIGTNSDKHSLCKRVLNFGGQQAVQEAATKERCIAVTVRSRPSTGNII
jgi:hypothetical protein